MQRTSTPRIYVLLLFWKPTNFNILFFSNYFFEIILFWRIWLVCRLQEEDLNCHWSSSSYPLPPSVFLGAGWGSPQWGGLLTCSYGIAWAWAPCCTVMPNDLQTPRSCSIWLSSAWILLLASDVILYSPRHWNSLLQGLRGPYQSQSSGTQPFRCHQGIETRPFWSQTDAQTHLDCHHLGWWIPIPWQRWTTCICLFEIQHQHRCSWLQFFDVVQLWGVVFLLR